MPLRIALIGCRGYPYIYSGYETLVRELAERLVKKGFQVTIYNHRNLFKNRPKVVNDIRLVYVPTLEKKTLSQFIHSFLSIIHACLKKHDFIFVMNSANGPFGLLTRIFHQKAAINVDGVEWLRPKWRGLGSRYFYWASKLATHWYDAVITDSLAMQRIYQREFGRDSTVIAYGADIRYPKPPERLGKWNLERDQYYLIVGRLIPDNNAGLMIREFIKTDSRRKLVVVGDVPYRDSYAENIKTMLDPRLVFTGYIRDREELAELYHYCYVYLHGHEYGGTNPTLLEALAKGCAVLALDTVFNRETLKNGEFGLFFSKREGNLKNRITELEALPRVLAELRDKSRQRIQQAYTWEKVTRQYEELIRQTVRGR